MPETLTAGDRVKTAEGRIEATVPPDSGMRSFKGSRLRSRPWVRCESDLDLANSATQGVMVNGIPWSEM